MATATQLAIIAAAQKAAGELHRETPGLDIPEITQAVITAFNTLAGEMMIGYNSLFAKYLVAFVAEYINRNRHVDDDPLDCQVCGAGPGWCHCNAHVEAPH